MESIAPEDIVHECGWLYHRERLPPRLDSNSQKTINVKGGRKGSDTFLESHFGRAPAKSDIVRKELGEQMTNVSTVRACASSPDLTQQMTLWHVQSILRDTRYLHICN